MVQIQSLAKIYIEHFIVNCIEKTKVKKKRPGMAHFFKKSKAVFCGGFSYLGPFELVALLERFRWIMQRTLSHVTLVGITRLQFDLLGFRRLTTDHRKTTDSLSFFNGPSWVASFSFNFVISNIDYKFNVKSDHTV